MYCPSCDQLGYPIGMLASSCQRRAATSKSISLSESSVRAAMYRPSGDQRGENNCSEDGRGEIFPDSTSTIAMPRLCATGVCLSVGSSVKTMDLPSADHVGSYPDFAPGMSSRRPVPSLEIR